MKNLLKIIFILILILSIYSCNEGRSYTHKYKILCVYNDGTRDTLTYEEKSNRTNTCVYLHVESSGLISDGGQIACLRACRNGFIACDIRRYEILSQETIIENKY